MTAVTPDAGIAISTGTGSTGHLPPPSTPVEREKASLERLAQMGVSRQYRTGTILINQGDHSGDLYIILSGAVRAFVEANDRTLTIDCYESGDYVGEMALDGSVRSASVITTAPTTCSVVSQEQLEQFIRSEPDFAMSLIKRLIARVRAATESSQSLALLDVYGRIRNLLIADSIERPDGTRIITGRMTHKDLAERVGASREMISKVLKELSVGGYIKIDRREIAILKPLPDRW